MTPPLPCMIAPARPADADELMAIQHEAYRAREVPLYGSGIPPLRETPDDLHAAMAKDGVWAARSEDGRLLGSVRVEMISPEEGHLFRMSVRPERHGQGIGRRLFAAGEAEIRRRGGVSVRIEVGERSMELRGMYERWGYQYAGERVDAPPAPPLLILRKRLRFE